MAGAPQQPKTFTPTSQPAKPAPVVMTPTVKPAGGPSKPPAKGGSDAPWWSAKWWMLTIGLVILLPAITLWSMGGFDPTIPGPKPYTDGAQVAAAGTVVVFWLALSVPLAVGGVLLRWRWPLVLVIVVLGFLWRIGNHFAASSVSIEELGARTFIVLLIALAAGGAAQAIYTFLGKK